MSTSRQEANQHTNSDYSSTYTYHIYDQVSDLIIIKQQRLERKRQLEHRRKVILAVTIAILVAAAIFFLLIRSLFASTQQTHNTSTDSAQDQHIQFSLTPSSGAHSNNAYTRTHLPSYTNRNHYPADHCNGRGLLVDGICICEPGFWGDKCDFRQTSGYNIHPSASQNLLSLAYAKCQLTNCNGNGICLFSTGRCQCHVGFAGEYCDLFIGTPNTAQQQQSLPIQANVQQILPQLSSAASSSSSSSSSSSIISSNSAAVTIGSQQLVDKLNGCPNQCNNKGRCIDNQCACFDGYTGASCAEEADLCRDVVCPTNGICNPQSGLCKCNFGYKNAPNCDERDEEFREKFFNCSKHGTYDFQLRECVCHAGYSGIDCDEEICDFSATPSKKLQCGPNGLFDCRLNRCVCQDGYSGDTCQDQQCSSQCLRNGHCVNGSCVCRHGYYGKHCSINGCPNGCSGLGQCVRTWPPTHSRSSNGSNTNYHLQSVSSLSTSSNYLSSTASQFTQKWHCQCNSGATGDDCSILTEKNCSDEIDNDGDGLVDCQDSECCSDKACQDKTLCLMSPDPLDILLKKQPPQLTASFFQRMQFLLENKLSQRYSNAKEFNDSVSTKTQIDRASVIRGKVVFAKQGVIGVKVAVLNQMNLGFTLTREGGYFDLMVNGGGALTLELSREPFVSLQKTIRVPWNEIVIIDQIEMSLDSSQSSSPPVAVQNQQQRRQQSRGDSKSSSSQDQSEEVESPTCLIHNHKLMRPAIVVAPKLNDRFSSSKSQDTNYDNNQESAADNTKVFGRNTASSQAHLLRQSGMIRQSVELLPASSSSSQSVSLVYISGKSSDFMSTISLQMTPPESFMSPDNNDALASNDLATSTTSSLSSSLFPSSSSSSSPSSSSRPIINLPQPATQTAKLIQELKLIHLKVVVEGIVFDKLFEPQANLTFTYAWNRRNVYRQKSYGVSTATVSIGYEYFECKSIIWFSKQVQLAGHDLPISNIGSGNQANANQQWNLNLHHRYNYRDAILHRGDGLNFNLKSDRSPIVKPLIGDGYQRPTQCAFCDSASSPPSSSSSSSQALSEQRLLSPSTLVSGPDGSLYIGDYNLIRKIEYISSGQSLPRPSIRTIFEMPPARVPSSYSLALSLTDYRLYMANAEKRQVFVIKESPFGTSTSTKSNDSSSMDDNMTLVVGSGRKCMIDDAGACGDKGPAKMARLSEPKALAFDLANRMYIADGATVRMVDTDSNIYTILGDYRTRTGEQQTSKQQQQQHLFPCNGDALPMHRFVPKWPLSLAISPLDESLHLLDDDVVYKLTADKRVELVAGRPAHCLQAPVNQRQVRASEYNLKAARQIAFGPSGELFITEDDQQRQTSRVLVVSQTDELISQYVGTTNNNNNNNNNNNGNDQLVNDQTATKFSRNSASQVKQNSWSSSSSSTGSASGDQFTKASDYKLSSVSAIGVDNSGKLIVADKTQLRIVSVEPDVPEMSSNGEYEVWAPEEKDELLVFNKFGFQIATKRATGVTSQQQQQQQQQEQLVKMQNKLVFNYTVNTGFGLLSSVSMLNNDMSGVSSKISITRDSYSHSAKLIELTSTSAASVSARLEISRSALVQSIVVSRGDKDYQQQQQQQQQQVQQPIVATSKTLFLYKSSDGGLLRQSKDEFSGKTYEFEYDEFGRASSITYTNLLASGNKSSLSFKECQVSNQPEKFNLITKLSSQSRRHYTMHLTLSNKCADLIVNNK